MFEKGLAAELEARTVHSHSLMGQIMNRRSLVSRRRQERSVFSGGGLPLLSFAIAAVVFCAVWYAKISRQVASSAMESPTGVMVLGMHRR